MLKYVKNVTSTDYILKGEVNTPNGITPISIRIIRGGLYEIDTHIRYTNLDEAIKNGDLVPPYEEKVEVVPEVPVEEDTLEDDYVEEEIPDEIQEESEDNTQEDVEETPEVGEDTADSVESDDGSLICPHCGAECATKASLTRHINKYHPEQ